MKKTPKGSRIKIFLVLSSGILKINFSKKILEEKNFRKNTTWQIILQNFLCKKFSGKIIIVRALQQNCGNLSFWGWGGYFWFPKGLNFFCWDFLRHFISPRLMGGKKTVSSKIKNFFTLKDGKPHRLITLLYFSRRKNPSSDSPSTKLDWCWWGER